MDILLACKIILIAIFVYNFIKIVKIAWDNA